MTPPSSRKERLPQRLLVDLTAALCASTLVAPVITIIDRSIINSTHSKDSLRRILFTAGKDAISHPIRFFTSTPFALITILYCSTYTTANLVDTFTTSFSHHESKSTTTKDIGDSLRIKESTSHAPDAASYSSTHATPLKFLATTTVNMSICLWKDARFAKLFGSPSSAARSVPLTTMALFGTRDSMTVFASFIIPPLLSNKSYDNPNAPKALLTPNQAQFIAPAGVQLLSTPMHLLGLDLYNRPGREVAWVDRWQKVKSGWFGTSLARMGRIVPAYGVGGVVNASLRRWGMEVVQGQGEDMGLGLGKEMAGVEARGESMKVQVER
jgi:hypothetical protein